MLPVTSTLLLFTAASAASLQQASVHQCELDRLSLVQLQVRATLRQDLALDEEEASIPLDSSAGGTPASSSLPLDVCAGDCDSDADCAGGLTCFQRSGYTTVSGCSGQGANDYDYCVNSATLPLLDSSAGASPVASRLPLGECTGDCDSDADCASGLTCFQRSGYTAVPGCAGKGANDYDFCIGPVLDDLAGGTPASSSLPLDVCAGDCDSDADCAGGLTCFQRSGYTAVPGCSGQGTNDYDYCIAGALPRLDSSAGATPAASSLPLGECAGDCDNDADCASGLTCFERSGYTAVPGCAGKGANDYDFCVGPVLDDSAGGTPASSSLPLDVCAGDCDSDADCAGGLVCFQRSGYTAVPGCQGDGKDDYDYCVIFGSTPLLDSSAGATPVASSLPLGECAGDCDSDADCASGLTCFERSGYTAVPSCAGKGAVDYDYCHLLDLDDSAGGTPAASSLPLDNCAGDCDSDADCASGLTCFQRSGYTTVPGCSGKGANDYDYCIAGSIRLLDSNAGATPVASSLPLGECAGDCDSDADCASGLTCFQRSGYTPVTGCAGKGGNDYDYCIAQASPTSSPTSSPTTEAATTTEEPCTDGSCTIADDPHITVFDGKQISLLQAGINTDIMLKNLLDLRDGDMADVWLVQGKTDDGQSVSIQARYMRDDSATERQLFVKSLAVGGDFLEDNTLVIGPLQDNITWTTPDGDCSSVLDEQMSKFNVEGLVKATRHTNARLVEDPSIVNPGVDIELPKGVRLLVNRQKNYVNVVVTMPALSAQDGLCGNFNGNANDDSLEMIEERDPRVANGRSLFPVA